VNEHEFEPVRGLPELPPEGEYIVWQGVPNWRGLARRVFHVRKVALYFALLIGWLVLSRLQDGQTFVAALTGASWLALVGGTALGLLYLLAWLYGRTTVYTLTNRRLALRFGVAIPMIINIPLEKIGTAGLNTYGDKSGDILLTLNQGEKISHWAIWPHARPWHYAPAQPMLRSVPDAEHVAAKLARVLRGEPTAAVPAQPPVRAAARRPAASTARTAAAS
jgi:hypothetical protein